MGTLRLLMATNHPAIDSIILKLESDSGIKELEKSLKHDGITNWAKPIMIVDEVKYRERLIEKAKAVKPDVILLYDKLPGAVELELLLEEIRLEVKNEDDKDTRIIFLTSLDQGSTLLRKAVELGVWDIVSGSDIGPIDILKSIYEPGNYSDVARYKLAPEPENQIKRAPAISEIKERVIEKPVEKVVIREIKEVKRQRIITWWSASGGEGKTTLAASQAYQLAKNTGEKVALLDFKEANPACNYWFNVMPKDTLEIIDAIEKGTLNQSILEANMVAYSKMENLKIFTGIDLYRISSWGAEYFDLVQSNLKYPYIIIDTNSGLFFSGTVSALQNSDTINVVVEPTYKSIEETIRWIEFIIEKWGIPQEYFRIYFNKLSFRTLDENVLRKGFEQYPIGGVYKYSDSVIEALNKGIPIVKGFENLIDDIIFFKAAEKRKNNVLSFLKR